MGKEIINQILEVHRVLGRINLRRNTLRHIAIKLTKIQDKDKMLKATGKNDIYPCVFYMLSADFTTKILQVRREWQDIVKVMKGKNSQTRILYPA